MRRILRTICRNSRLANALVHYLRHPGARISASAMLECEGSLVLGKTVVIRDSASLLVAEGSVLELGDRVRIGRGAELQPGGRIRIGADTGVQDRCILLGDISIGRNCILAPNVYASSGNHWFDLQPEAEIRMQDRAAALGLLDAATPSEPIRIGEDCWIGINCVIRRGVTIGRGAVIGANSVVTCDIEPYSVVAGSPARTIRKRLDFSPPSTIRSDRRADYPYFYSGFEPMPAGPLPEATASGRLAKAEFSLALDCTNARLVNLVLATADGHPGEIRFGDQHQVLSGAKTSASFRLTPGQMSILHFESLEPAGVVVLEAGVE